MAAGSQSTSLDIIYEVALKRLDEQLNAIESLEVKARAYATFAVALTALLVALLGKSSPQPVHILVELGALPLETLFGVFMALFFAFLFCVMVVVFPGILASSEVLYLVDVRDLLPTVAKLPVETTKHALVLRIASQLKHNDAIIRRKAHAAKWALRAVLAQTIAGLLAVVTWLLLVFN